MKIRILMLGPGEGIVGGISSLVETIVPALEQKVSLLYVSSVKNREMKQSGKVSLQNIFGALSQYIRFIGAFLRFRPHIIHLHTSQGLGLLKDTFYVLIARVTCCRILVHVHAAELNEFCGSQSLLIKSYIRKVMGLSDTIIAVSEEWRNRLLRVIANCKVFTFRNCIAVDSFSASLRVSSQNGMNVLFLGSVGVRKGAFDLLEAMGKPKLKNSSVQAWVAGYEEEEGDLVRAYTRRSQLRLEGRYHLVGTVLGAKKKDLLNKANIFVLPSRNEGLPMAVLEAMAAGLAIISTPVGGIPEIVKDGCNGFLIPPGDIDALADKIAFLETHPFQCQLMGKNSRDFAERELDVKPYIERLFSVYESMMEN